MTVAAQSRAPFMVFLGAAAALVLSALLGVAFGESLLKFVPVRYVRFGAGVLFLALGAMLVVGRSR